MPIETAVLVAFNESAEAHYFCTMLNSSPWRFVITSTAVHGTGGFGSPNVLKKAHIPKFNAKDKVHQELSGLSQNAHYTTEIGDEVGVKELEQRIDELAAQIWGLTEEELKEIQISLEEIV